MAAIRILTNLYGVGPVQADKIYKLLCEIYSVSALEKMNETQIRAALKKAPFFDKLATSTKIDLIYKPLKTIPRSIISIIEKELKSHGVKCDIAGSYRRGSPTSHDIDIVMLKTELSAMKKINERSSILFLYPPYAQGPSKITQIFELRVNGKTVRVKIDIFLTQPREYMFALLFAIGSGQFNIRMRSVAKRKGYLLNQRGLYKKVNDKLVRIPIQSEKDLFKKLNITYLEPKMRLA